MQKLDIKKVGVVLRPSTPELKDSFYKLKEIFNSYDIDVHLDSISGGMIDVMGMDFDALCQNSDILVTLGGDGTLISTVRRSFKYDIPVLGIHAGRLGFLADIGMDEIESFMQKLVDGEYRIDERSILKAKIYDGDKELKMYAFNDIVFTRPSISNMIHIDTLVDEKPFNTYYGDGVIVSTPTGSTAYNLSAGGPIIFPLTNVFALTPISPHSLTQRPAVLPGEYPIEMKTPDKKGIIIVDGQDMYELEQNQSVYIQLAVKKAKLIHRLEFNYFEVLKEKLGWGD
jgi:NAD+ kinase